jgi:VWFA-related protein
VKTRLLSLFFLTLCCFGGSSAFAQSDPTRLEVQVVLVELDVAVTDSKGNYISGLKPEDFQILEDNLPEKIRTFEEGAETPHVVLNRVGEAPSNSPVKMGATDLDKLGDGLKRASGSNLFILFDTSNYMYRGFVFAQDSIADFIRSLEGVNRMALYSYSRDLDRVAPLTPDRSRVLRGVRETVAGDDAALYNALLMTVKDAAPLSGRKVIVVFSNGPDNASLVPPEDISELAQSTGTIIYMISTRAAQSEPISSAVFERMTKATGGKAYFAKDWKDENRAFASIRDDLAHLYALSYYPSANPNHGFRKISVKLVGKDLQRLHIRTREGYRLLHQSEKQPQDNSLAKAR